MTKPLHQFGRGVVVVLALAAGLGVAGYVVATRPDPAYEHVASIREAAIFQAAAELDRAWSLPVASRYRAAGLEFQGNGSLCGPTSLVNLIRSTGGVASQEAILDGAGAKSYFGYLPKGLTLDGLADVTRRRLGAERVHVLRNLDLAAFRAAMREANDPSRRILVNFHRGPLFGTGGGHHSPVGAYLESEDLVLVLDVNRAYQPWLASTERLFEAVDTVDSSSGQKRGLLIIDVAPTP
jgi:hypothetical protein